MFATGTLAFALVAGVAFAAPEEERVTSLPEMGTFDQFGFFSGYVDIPDTTKQIHYLFVESQQDPSNDPLIIWFNGGPGCSSMLGFAQEHGPYLIADGTDYWQVNEYSWNREANVLYIESPAGVGYSWCGTEEDCTFNDVNSAADNLTAVLAWFDKYSEFKNNDLYISGESYAGIYVPTLSYNIDQWNKDNADDDSVFKPNLKGFMVGNGVTNWDYDCTAAQVPMYYYHDIYGHDLWDQFQEHDCHFRGLGFFVDADHKCQALLRQMNQLASQINIYNVDGLCFGEEPYPQLKSTTHGLTKISGDVRKYKRGATTYDYTPWVESPSDDSNGPIPPCLFGTPVSDYLNRADIRELLYIPEYLQTWELCTGNINYSRGPIASQWVYENLVGHSDYRILKFSGDLDGAVPTAGSKDWINNLGWTITAPWRPYYLDSQVGGYIEERGQFTFATVHGAGHMAPQYKPRETYHLIFNWIKGEHI